MHASHSIVFLVAIAAGLASGAPAPKTVYTDPATNCSVFIEEWGQGWSCSEGVQPPSPPTVDPTKPFSYGKPKSFGLFGNHLELEYDEMAPNRGECSFELLCVVPKSTKDRKKSFYQLIISGAQSVSYGEPEEVFNDGNRWRITYNSTTGHENLCTDKICYINKD